MSPDQALLVREKLASMEGYLRELASSLPPTRREYLAHQPARRMVERLIQVVVQSAIDANALLVEGQSLLPPASARESFQMARDLGAIDEDVREKFHHYVAVRNLLVHQYDRLDDKRVWKDAQQLLQDAPLYIAQVRGYLSAKNAKKSPRNHQ